MISKVTVVPLVSSIIVGVGVVVWKLSLEYSLEYSFEYSRNKTKIININTIKTKYFKYILII